MIRNESGNGMIKAEHISKKYSNGCVALKDISLSVNQGEKVSLFGPNGAGKTTFLRILTGLQSLTAGTLSIMGYGPENRLQFLKCIGMAPQSGHVYDTLTVKQNLHFYGNMYGMEKGLLTERINELLKEFDLLHKIDQPVSYLSKGMRQRLLIAKALLHDPQILLLDEPYSGLDVESAERLAAFLDSLKNKTVITATHDFEYGIRTGWRVIIFDEGIVSYDGQWDKSGDEFRTFYSRKVGRK